MDITSQVQRFRHASRDLRNHYFLPAQRETNTGDVLCGFAEVEQALFVALVLQPAGLPASRYGEPNPRIRVRVSGEFGAPAMINRERDSGYWDYHVKRLDNEADLAFAYFFDWDESSLVDFQYVRVEISRHPSQELVGKHALIEVQYVSFETA